MFTETQVPAPSVQFWKFLDRSSTADTEGGRKPVTESVMPGGSEKRPKFAMMLMLDCLAVEFKQKGMTF